jgi:hypothetical protein
MIKVLKPSESERTLSSREITPYNLMQLSDVSTE